MIFGCFWLFQKMINSALQQREEFIMVQPHFPLLADATLAAINTVGVWLAQDELSVTRQAGDRSGDSGWKRGDPNH